MCRSFRGGDGGVFDEEIAPFFRELFENQRIAGRFVDNVDQQADAIKEIGSFALGSVGHFARDLIIQRP